MESMKKILGVIGAIVLAGGLLLAPNDTCAAEDDAWRFELSPYLWAPDIDVKSTVSGQTAAAEADFTDIFDLVEFSGALRFEAWKSDFGIIVDGTYVKLAVDEDVATPGPTINVDSDIEDVSLDLTGAWRFADLPLTDGGERLIFDAIGGARYRYLKQKIKVSGALNSGGINVSGATNLGKSKDWLEPVVGLRVHWLLTERLSLALRGDVSGFGVGSASDSTWSLTGGVGYQFTDGFTAKLGYRHYDIDYSNGSGAEEFGLEGDMSGPYLSGTFHF